MYLGHLAPSLALRGRWPQLNLAVLLLASQAPDWVDAALLPFVPWSTSTLWSHSLPAIAVGLGLCAAAAWRWPGARTLIAAAAGLYLSHPLLDYVTGLKPAWPGGRYIGFALYTRPGWDFALEGAMLAAGWAVYLRSLPAGRRRSPWAWLLLLALLATQALLDLQLGDNLGPLGGWLNTKAG